MVVSTGCSDAIKIERLAKDGLGVANRRAARFSDLFTGRLGRFFVSRTRNIMTKNSFHEFIPPMMANSAKEPFDDPDWIFPAKVRCLPGDRCD
jgi:hypothetical protein